MAKKKAGRRANGTGAIYKDGDGYRVAVLIGTDSVTGKPQYRKARAKTNEEAVATLKRLTRELDSGHLTQANGNALGEYLDRWLEHTIKPLRAPQTHRQYTWLVEQHIKPHLGKKALDKVSRQDVQKLISLKVAQTVQARDKDGKSTPTKTLSTSTLRLIRAVLHSAYSDAMKDGLTGRNPAEHVEIPVAKKQAPKFLDLQQAVKLVEAVKACDLGPLLSFMLSTGTRVGEATGLRWIDVDFAARRVRIAGQLQRLDGKLEYRATTKTNRERHIPISDTTLTELQSLHAARMLNGEPLDPDGIVFLNAEGRRVDPKLAYNRLKAACRRANIPEVSPHKLRHTFATLALAETGDLHAVQKALGHSQVALTSDLYGHATAETLRPMTSAVERALRCSRD